MLSRDESNHINKIRVALESNDPNDKLILLDDKDILFSRELVADELKDWSVDIIIEMMIANLIMTRREYIEYHKSLALVIPDKDQMHLSNDQAEPVINTSSFDDSLSDLSFKGLEGLELEEMPFFARYVPDSDFSLKSTVTTENAKNKESSYAFTPVFNKETDQYDLEYLRMVLPLSKQHKEKELEKTGKNLEIADEISKPSVHKRKRKKTRATGKKSGAPINAVKEVNDTTAKKHKKRKTANTNNKPATAKKSDEGACRKKRKTETTETYKSRKRKKTATVIKATNYVYAKGDHAGKEVTGLSELELEAGIKIGSFITINSYTLRRLVWTHNGEFVSSEDLKDNKKIAKLLKEEKISTTAKYNRMKYLDRKKNPDKSAAKGKHKYVYAQGELAGQPIVGISGADLEACVKNGSIVTAAAYKGRRLVWESNGEVVSADLLKDENQIKQLIKEGKVIPTSKYRVRKSYHKQDQQVYSESEKLLATIIQTLPSPDFFHKKKKIRVDGDKGKEIRKVARHVLNGAGISLRRLDRSGNGLYKLKITSLDKYTEKWNSYSSGSRSTDARAASTNMSVSAGNKVNQFTFFYKPEKAGELAAGQSPVRPQQPEPEARKLIGRNKNN